MTQIGSIAEFSNPDKVLLSFKLYDRHIAGRSPQERPQLAKPLQWNVVFGCCNVANRR